MGRRSAVVATPFGTSHLREYHDISARKKWLPEISSCSSIAALPRSCFTMFLPAATLGAVGLGEGNTLCPRRLGQICLEELTCMVFGGYLDIRTADGNFGILII